MDISDEECIGNLLLYIDNTIQYGEDLDIKIPREVGGYNPWPSSSHNGMLFWDNAHFVGRGRRHMTVDIQHP